MPSSLNEFRFEVKRRTWYKINPDLGPVLSLLPAHSGAIGCLALVSRFAGNAVLTLISSRKSTMFEILKVFIEQVFKLVNIDGLLKERDKKRLSAIGADLFSLYTSNYSPLCGVVTRV